MNTLTPFKLKKRQSRGSPGPLMWTVEEFHKLGDLGCFEGRRAMLIRGVLVEEDPINPPHRIALELTTEVLRSVFGTGWRVCVRLPLVLNDTTDPEPDVAVVAGKPGDYTAHPTTAALVVEVSDSSLSYNTTTKMSLYAEGGIADYWVVDVSGRRLIVHRDPVADSTQPHNFTYRSTHTLAETDSVTPLAAPNTQIRVADLLP